MAKESHEAGKATEDALLMQSPNTKREGAKRVSESDNQHVYNIQDH